MTKEEFLRSFEETVVADVGTLTGGENLNRLENWDSVAVVVFLAQADEEFSVSLSNKELTACRTVDDLWDLVETRVHAAERSA